MIVESISVMIAETNRLILRKFKMSDLKTFLRYRNDPLVSIYQSWNNNLTKDNAIKFINQMENIDFQKDMDWIQIAFEVKDSRTHVGDCAIKRFDNGKQAEIGITLDRQHWGKGFAHEGLSALFSFAFTNLRLHRIIAITDTQNLNSINLLTKLGMRNEGISIESYFDNGKWTDELHYAILEHEWEMR